MTIQNQIQFLYLIHGDDKGRPRSQTLALKKQATKCYVSTCRYRNPVS
ncbi:MAG: hypothetical protein [Olavius algarvensis Delta 4 endosymbiont]|nr:MAG: hypothetical protein [Olavius algarvensis Delta 4 endosymbiont]